MEISACGDGVASCAFVTVESAIDADITLAAKIGVRREI